MAGLRTLKIMHEEKSEAMNEVMDRVVLKPFHLPMDLALTRWSVVCQSWGELANGHAPYLPAFLAGWYCRQIGATQPDDLGQFRDSFRVGWREANTEIAIASR